ncbi:MAG: quaternary ammonium transporter [Synechococcales cyanobacterium T60_A2020_003]|nr:quaternary ammonium transporter [Synechococcales cyanobacterium T60_A2020_003]
MKSLFRFGSLILLALLTSVLAIACNVSGDSSSATSNVIKVGSKDFPEQFILGEMYALMLENEGLTVERKLNLGGTPVAHAGLLNGEIDLYPEYTGTGLLTVLKQPAMDDPQAVFDAVSEGYKAEGLIWLDPAPMNNTQALAMTAEKAEQLEIRTLSDMAAKASQLVMIGPPEFEVREDGLPGLKQAYGQFELKEYKAVDSGLRYKGLVDGEADVVVAFGTDGEISAYNLVLLEDDKKLFPPYQVAPVVRADTLEAYPQIAETLNALSPKLTDAVMQHLNNKVSGNQREPADVAREFLVQEGLITE